MQAYGRGCTETLGEKPAPLRKLFTHTAAPTMRQIADIYIFIRQDRQCTYNVTLGRVRLTTVAVEKQEVFHILYVCSLSYPACVRVRRIILSSVTCLAVPYFPHDRVLIFSTNLSEKFLILRRIERDIIIIYINVYVKYPAFLSEFNKT
jgi:hypothetical protein